MSQEQETEQTQEQTQEEQTQQQAETVSPADYKKLMKELESYRSKADDLQQTLKHQEMQTLKDQERWKELYELEKKEKEEFSNKYSSMTEAIKKDRKMHEIKVAAQSAGIRKEAFEDLELYDFPEVQIETTSLGNVRVVGAREAIENLKLKRPHLFGKSTGSLNSSSPEVVQGGKISTAQIIEAQKKYKQSNSAADLKAYQELVNQYKAQ